MATLRSLSHKQTLFSSLLLRPRSSHPFTGTRTPTPTIATMSTTATTQKRPTVPGAVVVARRLATIKRMVTRDYVEPLRPLGNSEEIDFEAVGHNRFFTLNRPYALNALSHDMFYTMMKKADEWREDPDVNMVIGDGVGRAFAAGGDIKVVVENALAGKNVDAITMLADSFRLHWKMAHLGKPYCVFIDGITMGGGAGLALTAPVRVATPRTNFAMPEVRIGFSPEFGGSYWMNQLDGKIGVCLAMTSRDVFGREAYELGIATHYVAEESVQVIKERLAALESPTNEEVAAIVEEYHVPEGEGVSSKKNPNGRSLIRGDIRHFLDETWSLPSLKAIYDRLVQAETDPKLSKEVQSWAGEQRKMMDTRGPTGMAVALENYRISATAKRYATTVENDILLSTGFIGAKRASQDLMIGTVHSLFDKKKTPIPFNPSIKELDNPSLQPKEIRHNFLTRGSPTLFDCPPMDVGDALIPRPEQVSGTDWNWGNMRRFGIPSEIKVKQILDAAKGQITDAELVQRAVDSTKSSNPARRAEFEARVWTILADRTHKGTVTQWNE